ncbi:hypothetical protein JOD54_000804 [Actinokineospora baliensis]|uniref:hypothetical protein n=1 Tax=Actinokineospora baliensis TaxID=547056 RepID=UPI00195E7D81|nr:hypothetical protein [Actinokineospora baliensis]MBM7770600.1 hypothetical protein [Actinokineospora baliensis]
MRQLDPQFAFDRDEIEEVDYLLRWAWLSRDWWFYFMGTAPDAIALVRRWPIGVADVLILWSHANVSAYRMIYRNVNGGEVNPLHPTKLISRWISNKPWELIRFMVEQIPPIQVELDSIEASEGFRLPKDAEFFIYPPGQRKLIPFPRATAFSSDLWTSSNGSCQ